MASETEPTEGGEQPPAKATWVGDGSAFVAGVPSRDLTDDEWGGLTDEQKRAVLTVMDSAGKLLYEVADALTERAALGLEELDESEAGEQAEGAAEAPAAPDAPEGEPTP